MRKIDAAAVAARKAPATERDAAIRLVCLALTLSLIALACRIVSIW